MILPVRVERQGIAVGGIPDEINLRVAMRALSLLARQDKKLLYGAERFLALACRAGFRHHGGVSRR